MVKLRILYTSFSLIWKQINQISCFAVSASFKHKNCCRFPPDPSVVVRPAGLAWLLITRVNIQTGQSLMRLNPFKKEPVKTWMGLLMIPDLSSRYAWVPWFSKHLSHLNPSIHRIVQVQHQTSLLPPARAWYSFSKLPSTWSNRKRNSFLALKLY